MNFTELVSQPNRGNKICPVCSSSLSLPSTENFSADLKSQLSGSKPKDPRAPLGVVTLPNARQEGHHLKTMVPNLNNQEKPLVASEPPTDFHTAMAESIRSAILEAITAAFAQQTKSFVDALGLHKLFFSLTN